MLSVAKRYDRSVCIGTHRLPDALPVAEKAKVIDTLDVVLGLTVNQGIALTKSPVAVPGGINKGISFVRATDANIKTYLGRFHLAATPRGLIPMWSG